MKVRPSVKKICDKCRVIRRRGKHPRHLLEPAAQAAAGLGKRRGDRSVARIAGVDLPRDKRLDIALTYIYGVGTTSAGQDRRRAPAWTRRPRSATSPRTRSLKIRAFIDQNLKVEGDLRREVAQDIKRKIEIGCYQGIRHRRSLPVRGQRTHTNARTRKGPKKTIAGKKKAARKK